MCLCTTVIYCNWILFISSSYELAENVNLQIVCCGKMEGQQTHNSYSTHDKNHRCTGTGAHAKILITIAWGLLQKKCFSTRWWILIFLSRHEGEDANKGKLTTRTPTICRLCADEMRRFKAPKPCGCLQTPAEKSPDPFASLSELKPQTLKPLKWRMDGPRDDDQGSFLIDFCGKGLPFSRALSPWRVTFITLLRS